MESLNGLAFIPARHCADSLLISSRRKAASIGRLRTADRRQRLVLFPASAKGLVQHHEFVGCGQLGSRMLVLQESLGIMVNYLYEIETIESNHEAFVNDGTVMRSADVDALLAAEHISAPNSGQPESQEATGASAIESHELKFSK